MNFCLKKIWFGLLTFSLSCSGFSAAPSHRFYQNSLTLGAKIVFGKSFVKHSWLYGEGGTVKKQYEWLDEPLSQSEFEAKFTPISHERAVDIYYITGVLQFLFEKHHIQSLPVGGTLLGMLRNQGLLPHDDDADFAVVPRDYKKVKNLKVELAQYGLGLRSASGVGLQVYPLAGRINGSNGGRTTLGLNFIAFANTVVGLLPSVFQGLKCNLTKRGFVDIMPIKKHLDGVYRYSAVFAEGNWFHDFLSEAFVEEDLRYYDFGPLKVRAPVRELSTKFILRSYPHSLTHAQRTVDHQTNSRPDPILVPLTEEQKQAFPLNGDDRRELNNRFARAGLALSEDGFVTVL